VRICRYTENTDAQLGFYYDDHIVPLHTAAKFYNRATESQAALDITISPISFLPGGESTDAAHTIADWLEEHHAERVALQIPTDSVTLLAPLANPPKILLLAGNYASHLEEEGRIALEKEETFPYIFMKPRTTINHPNGPITIPAMSPDFIDYECELAIVIGKTAKNVPESKALDYVAGYTVVNDISDRKYKPVPNRKERDRDAFFDWQHGKWHDGFFPFGPAIASAQTITDPNTLELELSVNGEVRQQTNTDHMIYGVPAVIEFISRSVTLEPGDIIATGTTAGTGHALGKLLRDGDQISATIESIGTLNNYMVSES